MAHLHPIPFPNLLHRMIAEAEISASIFDLPVRKWHIPDPALDFSANHFSRSAATPVGPAAGPHTQLAQNIVLAWLAGGRIMELKTVQVLEDLQIPRPCIHVPNVGFNVEWSQELRVEDSLREYAKAFYLIEILKHSRGFGAFPTDFGFETIFDISVGYDLEGIRNPKITGFIRSLQDSEALFDQLRTQLPGDLAEFRDMELPTSISGCVTLSTFHGCPADQIESIALFLMEEMGLDVILKLNPTLLGFEEVQHLLHERMGYSHLKLRREAFEVDLKYEDGLGIIRRLQEKATGTGAGVGAKFTNTLVLENDPAVFPTQAEPYMYLSGPPLHVISMTLMQRFKEDLGVPFPASFSAGVDAKNFPAAVGCGLVPVTTCTDLLRQGGFGRLPSYLRALAREMKECGVGSREAFVLSAGGHGEKATEDALALFPGGEDAWRVHGEELRSAARTAPDTLPGTIRRIAEVAGLDPEAVLLSATRVAGQLNGRDYVAQLPDDDRYHWARNSKPPKGVDSTLARYDCLNCDLCISACPNDAIFPYDARPMVTETRGLTWLPDGSLQKLPGTGFSMEAEHQLAVYAGACNECSNCEVYCPEIGAPYQEKERLYPSLDHLEDPDAEGFFGEGDVLWAKLDGTLHRLEVEEKDNRCRLMVQGHRLVLDWDSMEVLEWEGPGPVEGGEPGGLQNDRETQGLSLDTATLWRMKTVWDSIYHSSRPNPVNPAGG